MKKIGIIIADDMEYAPLKNLGVECKYFGRDGNVFSPSADVEIHSVCCGIGKVNAAAAAMFLLREGCEIILNAGLSGGICGVSRGELVIANRFIEYDFDLTPLGYKKAEKPSQKYIYDADERLVEFFKTELSIKKVGMAVTGDRFVSDSETRDYLINEYNALSCDMETAAIASVCDMFSVPFISLRRISDDAGADATSAYREMNENEKFDLAVLLHSGAVKIATLF